MKHPKTGFTLIELLVVVLIIGILTAVALPQYQKAVLKARVAQELPTLKAIKNAQEVYYLTHGEYSLDVRNLDIAFPIKNLTTDESGCRFHVGETFFGIYENYVLGRLEVNSSKLIPRIMFYYNHADNPYAGKAVCYNGAGTVGSCKWLGGVQQEDSYYLLPL